MDHLKSLAVTSTLVVRSDFPPQNCSTTPHLSTTLITLATILMRRPNQGFVILQTPNISSLGPHETMTRVVVFGLDNSSLPGTFSCLRYVCRRSPVGFIQDRCCRFFPIFHWLYCAGRGSKEFRKRKDICWHLSVFQNAVRLYWTANSTLSSLEASRLATGSSNRSRVFCWSRDLEIMCKSPTWANFDTLLSCRSLMERLRISVTRVLTPNTSRYLPCSTWTSTE